MSRRVAFKTLGCRLNQHETESIATQFRAAGYTITAFDEAADVYVINTCTVTGQSDQKSRQCIQRARRHGGAPLVVITGCMATRNREALEADDALTYVIDNERKSAIFPLVEAHFRGEITHPQALPAAVFDFPETDRRMRTRSMVKVQDGCDNFCSFCIIPSVRGRAISRPLAEVLVALRRVVEDGAREVVLTGVNIGRYRDGDLRFDDLLAAMLEVPGDFRVRVSSLEPDVFGERFYELLTHPRMTPHLHLCVQSGSERILRRMRRVYTAAGFLACVARVRERQPDFNFTTDILVGFPGETDTDFEATLALMREVAFGHVHTFKYSAREGTRAEGMPDPIPEEIKTRRSAAVEALAESTRAACMARMVGRSQRLLVERVREGFVSGYGEHYFPLELEAVGVARNAWVDARVVNCQVRDGRMTLVGATLSHS